jgi:hypothetical protein
MWGVSEGKTSPPPEPPTAAAHQSLPATWSPLAPRCPFSPPFHTLHWTPLGGLQIVIDMAQRE